MELSKENVIGIDFQGWPIYKLTLRNIIEQLGFQKMKNEGNIYWRIEDNNPILDISPDVLTDDGMGYGVDLKCIVECDPLFDDNGKIEKINIFIDKEDEKISQVNLY